MKTFTFTIREGEQYGVLSRIGAEAIPFRLEQPDEATMILHLDLPPCASLTAALDRTIEMAIDDSLADRVAEEFESHDDDQRVIHGS